MPESRRRSPEELLAEIEREHLGKLRIYLGAAPGVGKTYTMLGEAQYLRETGVDIVVGVVDTHGRPDTAAKLAGLECIPPKVIEYRGITLEELDVPAIVARRPEIVLVDELAHNNPPGSLHQKRYQDVEEILAAGIDVWSTVNIQHVESLNDVVKQVTGIRVQETIPDRIVRDASEVRLIDLTPEELIERLKQGKVYKSTVVQHALKNFFRTGNLHALRELALRVVAESTDDRLEDYMASHDIRGPWPANERIMVCITPSPTGSWLVRRGARRAQRLKAEFYVVYVRTENFPPETERGLAEHVQLARRLQAKVVELRGEDTALTILNFAREHHITEIIMGQSNRSRWQEFRRGSVINRVLRGAGPIDVLVVAPEQISRPVR